MPSDQIEQAEDAHVVIAHSVCVALRVRLDAQRGWPAGTDRVMNWLASEVGA